MSYADIASVETREEIYTSFGLVTMQRVFSVVTRKGDRFLLGVMAENWGAQLAYDEAAARIAAHAQLPLTDRGSVRVGGVIHAMMYDAPSWDSDALSAPEQQRWHRRAGLTMQFIMVMLAVIAILRACGPSSH